MTANGAFTKAKMLATTQSNAMTVQGRVSDRMRWMVCAPFPGVLAPVFLILLFAAIGNAGVARA